MAALRLPAFVFEMELLDDAVNELIRIQSALAGRHGPAFRDLERQIEALAVADCYGQEHYEWIEPMRAICLPPDDLKALLIRAKALGV